MKTNTISTHHIKSNKNSTSGHGMARRSKNKTQHSQNTISKQNIINSFKHPHTTLTTPGHKYSVFLAEATSLAVSSLAPRPICAPPLSHALYLFSSW